MNKAIKWWIDLQELVTLSSDYSSRHRRKWLDWPKTSFYDSPEEALEAFTIAMEELNLRYEIQHDAPFKFAKIRDDKETLALLKDNKNCDNVIRIYDICEQYHDPEEEVDNDDGELFLAITPYSAELYSDCET